MKYLIKNTVYIYIYIYPVNTAFIKYFELNFMLKNTTNWKPVIFPWDAGLPQNLFEELLFSTTISDILCSLIFPG